MILIFSSKISGWGLRVRQGIPPTRHLGAYFFLPMGHKLHIRLKIDFNLYIGIDLPHGSITLFGTTFGGSPTNHQFGNPVKRKTSGIPPPPQLPFGNSQPPLRPGI